MSKSLFPCALLMVAIVAIGVCPAPAAIIASLDGTAPAGRHTEILLLTSSEGDVADAGNLLFYDIDFQPGDTVVDLLITVDATSAAATEYLAAVNHFNNTGVAWTYARLILGYGMGDDFVASDGTGPLFTEATDDGNFDSTTFGPTVIEYADPSPSIGGEIFGGGGIWDPTFKISVPGATGIPAFALVAGGYQFTIRAEPNYPVDDQTSNSVPEPATSGLLALVMMVGYARRHHGAAVRR